MIPSQQDQQPQVGEPAAPGVTQTWPMYLGARIEAIKVSLRSLGRNWNFMKANDRNQQQAAVWGDVRLVIVDVNALAKNRGGYAKFSHELRNSFISVKTFNEKVEVVLENLQAWLERHGMLIYSGDVFIDYAKELQDKIIEEAEEKVYEAISKERDEEEAAKPEPDGQSTDEESEDDAVDAFDDGMDDLEDDAGDVDPDDVEEGP